MMVVLFFIALLAPAATGFQIQPQSSQRTRLYLQPIEDPNAKLATKSLAGVSYQDVLQGLDGLYPPTDYSQRNQISREGGYWPFIKGGEEPPRELTYGEFDLPFFAEIIDKANSFAAADSIGSWAGKTFCDIGSGTGRLVISAAALHPDMKLCRGVEYLTEIHEFGEQIVWQCRNGMYVSDDRSTLPMAPIELTRGSIGDPYTYIADIDVAFISSSAMTSDVLEMISVAVGTQCKVGTIVVSTDYEIPSEGIVDGKSYKLELLEVLDGYCWVVGGTSTAYFYRLVQSCDGLASTPSAPTESIAPTAPTEPITPTEPIATTATSTEDLLF